MSGQKHRVSGYAIDSRLRLIDHSYLTTSARRASGGSMKAQLESLVSQMLDDNIIYAAAVRELRKAFILVALADNHGNQCKTARALGMHRNTLGRALAELGIAGKRRPPERVGITPARWRQQ